MRAFRFRDRREAGRMLATQLPAYADRDDVVVLALPRGGVPVAAEVARALRAPLDVLVVRKIGVPGHEELAMGAVDARGTRLIDRQIVRALRLTDDAVDQLVAAARTEALRRERAYRPGRPPLALGGRIAVLVDDGLATGFTMAAAVSAARAAGAIHVVVAAPVAARDTGDRMRGLADACVCIQEVEPLHGVAAWYDDFRQLSDDEVCRILARETDGAAPPGAPVTQGA